MFGQSGGYQHEKNISVVLICILSASLLVGCGKREKPAPAPEAYAGLYALQFVVQKDLSAWSVTPKKDGTGSLYRGENNSGPITEWSIDGEKLVIHACDTVIEYTWVMGG